MEGTINPQMVMLGRLSRGLTQADLAKRLGVQQGTVSKIEAGSLAVDSGQLASLCSALGYPESFFHRQEPIDGPGILEMYHARKRKTVRAITLHKAYATATIKRMHIEALLRSCGDPDSIGFPVFPADEFGDAEKVARTVRAQMSLPVGPIHSMTDVIERAGGIIIKCDFESHQIDGFTRWRQSVSPPLFFINRHLVPDRWRWTLAHEMGHAVMHTNQYPSDTMEMEADAFAREFLMPRQAIKHQLVNISFNKLSQLKLYWKVAIQALIMRAADLQLISPRQKTYMFMRWSRAGYRLREPEELDPPTEPPTTLNRLIETHLTELGYTHDELAAALDLFADEFREQYGPKGNNRLRLVK